MTMRNNTMSEEETTSNYSSNSSTQQTFDIPPSDSWQDDMSDYIVRLADMAYSMEVDRYQSLLQTGSNLMTAISILSVVYIATLDLIFSNKVFGIAFDSTWEKMIFITFTCIVISFLLALASSYRFKYVELDSPKVVKDHILKEAKEYKGDFAIAKGFADSLQGPYQSLSQRNGTISFIQRLSSLFLAASCVIFSTSIFFLL